MQMHIKGVCGKTIKSDDCLLCGYIWPRGYTLIVLGFNDTSTLVDHFVSSPRDREKRDRRDSRRDEREDREERGTGVKVKKQKK